MLIFLIFSAVTPALKLELKNCQVEISRLRSTALGKEKELERKISDILIDKNKIEVLFIESQNSRKSLMQEKQQLSQDIQQLAQKYSRNIFAKLLRLMNIDSSFY